VILCVASANAQWTTTPVNNTVSTPTNTITQGSAVIGANVAPSSSALELRSGGSNYNTLLSLKSSDFNSGSIGTMFVLGLSSSTYTAKSIIQAYGNGGNSVGYLMLNYIGGYVGVGPYNLGATPPEAPQYGLDVHGTLHATGNVTFDGTVTGGSIRANYQDVAEWVPSAEELGAGTVVVLNLSRDNEVISSTRPYDTTVAGVVSARPGVILGEAGAGKAQVATTGRVKVKVDAVNGAIAIGDLLVTSARTGYAMKSKPVLVGDIAMHRPGTIIGKALQALPAGSGEILVLLSLQ
jgi:hypothetical protein